ncbi:hypothetical protein [Orenia marismortui]|uniref:hypothetical protein n=1 Tax=Orenia marismortui TaxID=46469 RepID=UPI001417037F|nr:hypothetical protein [Orenia marismortui]
MFEEDFKEIVGGIDFNNRKEAAKKLLDNFNIKSGKISVKKIGANGYCRWGVKEEGVELLEYALDSGDLRDSRYKTKTLFHEFYHASLTETKFNQKTFRELGGKWSGELLNMEETMAETSGHYLARLSGVKGNIKPAYPEKLVKNLPRLKEIDNFKDCVDIEDFGKIFVDWRIKNKKHNHKYLYNKLKDIDFDIEEYSKKYKGYVLNNKDKIVDSIMENLSVSPGEREAIREEVFYRISRAWNKMNTDDHAFYDSLIVAMQKKGVEPI